MIPSVIERRDSMLDHPPMRFAHRPFYAETLNLLRTVRDQDLPQLSVLYDDVFGIVDIDPSGSARPIRNRLEWERWFHELFATGWRQARWHGSVISSNVPEPLKTLTNREN